MGKPTQRDMCARTTDPSEFRRRAVEIWELMKSTRAENPFQDIVPKRELEGIATYGQSVLYPGAIPASHRAPQHLSRNVDADHESLGPDAFRELDGEVALTAGEVEDRIAALQRKSVDRIRKLDREWRHEESGK